MVIVSDTSPLANLILIDKLEILREVFVEIIVPPSVNLEVERLSTFSVPLDKYRNSQWIMQRAPLDLKRVSELKEEIDEGESEAIALCIELKADYVLIDERIGTRIARENGLKTVGLIGVLVMAKEKGVIERVEPIINALVEKAGFWISEKLIDLVLKQVNER